ncbi:hypothetical protein MIR68_005536 [Amoeboaphelidium protococcarum]|nr:hypothetical protein MIR68_005536 [Amoeboaphelidium protococcarum]
MERTHQYFDKIPKINYWTEERSRTTTATTDSASALPGDGVYYYYNHLTKQTRNEKPQEIVEIEQELTRLRREEKIVESVNVPDTQWIICITNLGHIFYHQSTLQLSQWECPEEVQLFLRQSDEDASLLHDAAVDGPSVDEVQLQSNVNASYSIDIIEQVNDDINTSTPKVQNAPTERVKSDTERRQEYLEMLQEIGVNKFSSYIIEVKKIKNDHRFKAFKGNKKKLFDEYCSSLSKS